MNYCYFENFPIYNTYVNFTFESLASADSIATKLIYRLAQGRCV